MYTNYLNSHFHYLTFAHIRTCLNSHHPTASTWSIPRSMNFHCPIISFNIHRLIGFSAPISPLNIWKKLKFKISRGRETKNVSLLASSSSSVHSYCIQIIIKFHSPRPHLLLVSPFLSAVFEHQTASEFPVLKVSFGVEVFFLLSHILLHVLYHCSWTSIPAWNSED